MSPRTLLFALGVFLLGSFFVANGALMAFKPDLFLRFVDWYSPGDYWSKTADWRTHVYDLEYRLAGLAFLVMGVLMLAAFVRVLVRG